MNNYSVSGEKRENINISIRGDEVYKIFEKEFRDATGLTSSHIIEDGNLILETEYQGHTTWWDKEVVCIATDEDIILLRLRNDIYNRLCK